MLLKDLLRVYKGRILRVYSVSVVLTSDIDIDELSYWKVEKILDAQERGIIVVLQ